MRYGAVFPQTEIEPDPESVFRFAHGIEELGLDHLLAYDHVLGVDASQHEGFDGRYESEDPFHEIFVLFGYLAAATPGLELVTSVLVAPQRQTAVIAKQAAEVDQLTKGRFRLGVGLGWNELEYEGLGADFSNRGKRLEEQIELLRRLWQEPAVSFDGDWHTLRAVGINPLPVQRPIPIWFGGWTERALRRVARLADGYLPQRPPEEGWPATVARIRGWMEEAGRDPAGLGIEPRIEVGTGEPDDWRREAETWEEIGVSHLSLLSLGGEIRGADAHLERIAQAHAVLTA